MQSGPIILIDDEKDDIRLLREALIDLEVKNQIISFNNSTDALNFFAKTNEKPFLILCDVNMPRIDGFELRRKLYDNLHPWIVKVPFLFLSTTGSYPLINEPNGMPLHGYFIKPTKFYELGEMLKSIISYWTWCEQPIISRYILS